MSFVYVRHVCFLCRESLPRVLLPQLHLLQLLPNQLEKRGTPLMELLHALPINPDPLLRIPSNHLFPFPDPTLYSIPINLISLPPPLLLLPLLPCTLRFQCLPLFLEMNQMKSMPSAFSLEQPIKRSWDSAKIVFSCAVCC